MYHSSLLVSESKPAAVLTLFSFRWGMSFLWILSRCFSLFSVFRSLHVMCPSILACVLLAVLWAAVLPDLWFDVCHWFEEILTYYSSKCGFFFFLSLVSSWDFHYVQIIPLVVVPPFWGHSETLLSFSFPKFYSMFVFKTERRLSLFNSLLQCSRRWGWACLTLRARSQPHVGRAGTQVLGITCCLLGLEAEMGHQLLAWNYGIPNVVIAFVLNTSPSLFLVSSLLFEYWDFFLIDVFGIRYSSTMSSLLMSSPKAFCKFSCRAFDLQYSSWVRRISVGLL